MDSISRFWVGDKRKLNYNDGVTTVRLAPGQVFTVFLVMVAAMTLSLVCLTLEMIFVRCKKIIYERYKTGKLSRSKKEKYLYLT